MAHWQSAKIVKHTIKFFLLIYTMINHDLYHAASRELQSPKWPSQSPTAHLQTICGPLVRHSKFVENHIHYCLIPEVPLFQI